MLTTIDDGESAEIAMQRELGVDMATLDDHLAKYGKRKSLPRIAVNVDFGEQTEMDYRCLDRMEIRHTLADVAAITRNHDYAAKLYDEVLAEIPDDVDALVGLSYATNDPERATALAKRALAVDPDHPGAIDRVAELEANE